jgi:hypothetical protein
MVYKQQRFRCKLEPFLRFNKYLATRQFSALKSATAHTQTVSGHAKN